MPRVETRRRARHVRAVRYWLVALGWCLSLWLGTQLVPQPWLHTTALFGHLACVVVGLGSIVLLEVSGVRWVRGRVVLDEVLRTEHTATQLAWLGIVGLLATGAVLEPNLGSPLTWIKMIAVLVVALNGVAMTRLTDELRRMPTSARFAQSPRSVQAWSVRSSTVSQIGWWTAVLIGMLTTSA